MRLALAAALAGSACAHAAVPATTSRAAALTSSCEPAVPSGGDDAALIQAAITAGCCLGPGTFAIATPVAVPPARRRYDMLTVPVGKRLCGAGAATVLAFTGDASQQDWRGVALSGELADTSLDTSALVNTSEQTHAVRIAGPVAGVRISGVTFNHPIRGSLPGGDCVDIVGYAGSLVTDTVIRDNTFAHCDRAGVQIHSGAVGLTIERNWFLDTGDMDINSEPGGASSDWLVTGNVFRASPSNQGAIAVAFDLVERARLVGNTLERGVYLYGCQSCSVVGNTIVAQSGHSANQGTIDAIKGSSNLSLIDNAITRAAGSDTGPVIHVGPHGTERATGIRIVHNTLTQATPTDVVYLEGVDDAVIADNAMTYVPTTGIASGVRIMGAGGTAGTRAEHTSVVGNTLAGALRSAVFTAGASNRQPSADMLASWNTTDRPGLICENLSGVLGPITLNYNTWAAGSCGMPPIPVTLP